MRKFNIRSELCSDRLKRIQPNILFYKDCSLGLIKPVKKYYLYIKNLKNKKERKYGTSLSYTCTSIQPADNPILIERLIISQRDRQTETERDRHRQRERQRQRETDRQTQRETERYKTETDTQTGTKTKTETETETETETDRQTETELCSDLLYGFSAEADLNFCVPGTYPQQRRWEGGWEGSSIGWGWEGSSIGWGWGQQYRMGMGAAV